MMSLNFRKISIFTLMAVFLTSALLCCCITKTVQAKEPVPSCHQAHNTETSPSNEECDCDQSSAIIKKDIVFKQAAHNIVMLFADLSFSGQIPAYVYAIAYQAPPTIYDSLPLYIKHSILRI